MEAYNADVAFVQSSCGFCGTLVSRLAQPGVRIHFCGQQCKAEYQRLAKPVTREWLHEQYVDKGRDCPDIAKEVHRDPKSVWNWLKDFGIPTRPRGLNWSRNLIIGSGSDNGFYGRRHSRKVRTRLREQKIRSGHVPYLRNGQHWMKTAKKDELPNWKGGITPERQAMYASKEWGKAFRAVWKRDKATCQRCKKKHEKGCPFDVHHIVGFACRELRTEVSNLVLLCEKCHYWVHGPKNRKGRFLKPCP